MSETKVVRLRPASGQVGGANELARLATRVAARPAERRELVLRLLREPEVVSSAERFARRDAAITSAELLRAAQPRLERGLASLRADSDVVAWAGRVVRNVCAELARGGRGVARPPGAAVGGGSERATPPSGDVDRRRAVVFAAWEKSSADLEVQPFWERIYLGLSLAQLLRRSGHERAALLTMVGRGGVKLLRAWREMVGVTSAAPAFACIDPRLEAGVALRCAELLDGEAAREESAHLAACHACSEAEAHFADLMHVLAAVPAEGDARASWRAQLVDRRHEARRNLLPSTAAFVAAAGVLVALVVIVAWQRARDATVVDELRALRAEVARLRDENGRLQHPEPTEPRAAADGAPR